MISVKVSGNLKKTESLLKKDISSIQLSAIRKSAEKAITKLRLATPVDSGITASSWKYKIIKNSKTCSIEFYNDNVNNGVPIAIILQYGHATKNGGWVEGVDYINPAIKPIFKEIASDVWKEVIKR